MIGYEPVRRDASNYSVVLCVIIGLGCCRPSRKGSVKILPGRIGTIRRELEGKPCPFCACTRYQVVLKCGVEIRRDSLYAQCCRCYTRLDLAGTDLDANRIANTTFLRYGPDLLVPAYPFWTGGQCNGQD